MTGLALLLSSYPQTVAERAISAINGFPARFKFFPSIAEAKEALEEWAAEDARALDLRERYSRPIQPAISGPLRRSMRDELCERFGIRDIPPGWDAVEVTRQAAKHGRRLVEVVDAILERRA